MKLGDPIAVHSNGTWRTGCFIEIENYQTMAKVALEIVGFTLIHQSRIHALRSPADVKPLGYVSTWGCVAERTCAGCFRHRDSVAEARCENPKSAYHDRLCNCPTFINAAVEDTKRAKDERERTKIVKEVNEQLRSSFTMPGKIK